MAESDDAEYEPFEGSELQCSTQAGAFGHDRVSLRKGQRGEGVRYWHTMVILRKDLLTLKKAIREAFGEQEWPD